jgi:hypothetical protein
MSLNGNMFYNATWSSGSTMVKTGVVLTAVGDYLVFGILVAPSTCAVTGIAGSVGPGAIGTAVRLGAYAATARGVDLEIWIAPITTAGSITLTVTFSGTVAGGGFQVQEFSALGGTWSIDGSAATATNTTTGITTSSLTPAGVNEMYFSLVSCSQLPTPGTTAGYTYQANGSGYAYAVFNSTVTSGVATAATMTMASTGEWASISVLVESVASGLSTRILPVGAYAGWDNASGIATVAAALTQQPIIHDYLDATSPSVMSQSGNTVQAWHANGPAGAKYMFSVPLLWSGNSGGTGLPTGTYSVANVLAGDYDANFNSCFASMQTLSPGSIVRLGWEMDDGEFCWAPQSGGITAANYISLFQHVAALAHAYGLLVSWCPTIQANTDATPSQYWPGASYVDYVGADIYAQYWEATSGNPTEPSLWNMLLTQGMPFVSSSATLQGLEWYAAYAALYSKPLLFGEVGLWAPTTTWPNEGGTGDDPYFIKQIMQWAENNSALLFWWCTGSDGLFLGSPNPTNSNAQAALPVVT